MAGVWTSVCVMFPALDAKAAGFNVYAVVDASGDPTEFVSRTAVARFIQAGVVPTSTNAVVCELHRTWRRPEAAESLRSTRRTCPLMTQSRHSARVIAPIPATV